MPRKRARPVREGVVGKGAPTRSHLAGDLLHVTYGSVGAWGCDSPGLPDLRGLFRTSEDYFRTRRVAIGDGPLSGRIGFAYSTYRKRTVERVLYHRVLSL